jgi:hypothetical protein
MGNFTFEVTLSYRRPTGQGRARRRADPNV